MYNGDGLRTEKWGDRTTQYIILDGTYLGERTSFYGGINYLITYIYGAEGSVIGLDVNGTAYYFVKNLQGDVTSIIDVNGNVVANYTYDAYGYCMSITDGNGNEVTSATHIANLNPFRYRGYFYDQETGFYYLRSRYYDPAVCRFLNADGEIASVGGDIQGYNQFVYCFNNPVNMDDQSGNWPKWLTGALNVVSGVAQMAAAVVVGAAAGWTGIGAVAAGILVVNGAATITQGVGQIVNAVADKEILREDNLIRTGAQVIGKSIGGDTGGEIAGAAYDLTVMAASCYLPSTAAKQGLENAGVIPKTVKISELVPDPGNPMTDEGINYWTRTLAQNNFKGYNTLPNAHGDIEPICVQIGTNLITNGHHRVAVLAKYGIEKIKVFLVP